MNPENLNEILQNQCGLQSSDILVLGFSGGPDSSVLLHLLRQLGKPVLVAHLDHGLRPESAQDAKRAEASARNYSFPFFTEQVDVNSYADKHSMSIEEAARELRYEYLFRVADQQGGHAVVVAHNADDQVETVIMHLLRGAGSRGLRGMSPRFLPNPWSKTTPLLRPMLGFWRQEILDYCQTNDLQPLQDQSNQDTAYFRNRLRLELLPHLEQFSPGIKRRLHDTADLLQAESLLLDSLAEGAWQRCLSLRAENFLKLDKTSLLAEPLTLQRMLLRRAAEILRPGLRDLDFNAVSLALVVLEKPASMPQDWVAGLCLLAEGDHLWVADWEADLTVDWPQAPGHEVHIETPASLALNNHWHLEVHEEMKPRDRLNPDAFQAWLDQDQVGDELVLRNRRPGDRFQPLGMQSGSQKLADFMINEKMPRRARDTWPLLCKGEEIVWVPGYRLAHPYRLREGSNKVLHVSLQRSNGSA